MNGIFSGEQHASMERELAGLNEQIGDLAFNNYRTYADAGRITQQCSKIMRVLQFIQQQLAQVGIKAQVQALEAGQRGELIWQFAEATMVDFACLIPGHTEAGMVGKIHIE